MYKYGGVYMDLDAIALRDFAPLRRTGFPLVLGEQLSFQLGNGLMMAARAHPLMDVWLQTMHKMYDGGWDHHSVKLLTTLVKQPKFASGVLILARDTFFPYSWEKHALYELFGWDRPAKRVWTTSYALHVFDSVIKGHNMTNLIKQTVSQLRQQRSNFARAVWPVVEQALASGVLIEANE
jgi:hypothetical protein